MAAEPDNTHARRTTTAAPTTAEELPRRHLPHKRTEWYAGCCVCGSRRATSRATLRLVPRDTRGYADIAPDLVVEVL